MYFLCGKSSIYKFNLYKKVQLCGKMYIELYRTGVRFVYFAPDYAQNRIKLAQLYIFLYKKFNSEIELIELRA